MWISWEGFHKVRGFTFLGRLHCHDTLTPFLISLLRVWMLEECLLSFFFFRRQNLSENTGQQPRWPQDRICRPGRWCFNHILTTNKITCAAVRGSVPILLIVSVTPALESPGWKEVARRRRFMRRIRCSVERRGRSYLRQRSRSEIDLSEEALMEIL